MNRNLKKTYCTFKSVNYSTPITFQPRANRKLLLVMEKYGQGISNIVKIYDDQLYTVDYNNLKQTGGRVVNDDYDSIIYLLNNMDKVKEPKKYPCCILFKYRLLLPKGIELQILNDKDFPEDLYRPLRVIQELF